MKTRALAVLVIFGATLSACAGAPARPVPGSEGVVVEAPTFAMDDEWRFVGARFPAVIRVVGFEGDLVVTEFSGDTDCQGCRYFRDKNLTAVKIVNAQGVQPPYTTTGLRMLDFPLYVGKEWTQRIELYSRGTLQPYSNRFRVEALEEVTVKAGTFKAFRITQYQEALAVGNLYRGTATRWWSPEVKWFVKFEPFSGTRGRETELESFRLQAMTRPQAPVPAATARPAAPPSALPEPGPRPMPEQPVEPPRPTSPVTPVARAAMLEREARQLLRDGRFVEGVARAREAVTVREEILGPRHLDVAESLTTLGELYRAQGKYADAERLHRRALQIREERLTRDHPLVAESLNGLALLATAQATYRDAEVMLQRALEILESVRATLLRNYALQAEVLENLAKVYRALGRNAEADEAESKAAMLYTLR